MNTKTALIELSTRFDAFEERFNRLGADVSTIAALFYNYLGNYRPYVNTFGWQPINVSSWRHSEIEELVLANVRAWSDVLNQISEKDIEVGKYNGRQEEKPTQ